MLSRTLAARYAELKQEVPGCLLLMQVGAFMQVLDEDARTVAGVTGLKLQLSGDIDAPVVSGGFPRSGLDAYVGRLVPAGHSLALAFEIEKERQLQEVERRVFTGAGGSR